MSGEDGVDNTVRITHYINPHCFWYKPEQAYLPHHKSAQFLAQLNEQCETSNDYRNGEIRSAWYMQRTAPKAGDLVAHRSQRLGRWIRCEVESTVVDVSGDIWYQLWAIDEGFPIKSSDDDMRPIPEACRSAQGHAKRGALMNILPGEMRYDYIQAKSIMKSRPTWSSGIVATLQKLLKDAMSVSMLEKAHVQVKNEILHIGDIYIRTSCSKSLNVVDLLRNACSDHMMICCDEEFFKALKLSKSLQNMKRYENNEGIDNTPQESKRSKPSYKPIKTQPSVDPLVQNNEEDWASTNSNWN